MAFYQFLLTMQNRTGGQQGISSAAVQTTAVNAQTTATTAQTTATLASELAQISAAEAQLANTTAQSALLLAQEVALEALIKSSLVIPIVFPPYTNGSPTNMYAPISAYITCPANLAGLSVWAGVAASNDTTFNISFIRGGGTYAITGFTLTAGTNNTVGLTASSPSVKMQLGDVLVLAPATVDMTLDNFVVSIPFSLTS
jgi:hypothetical protein